MASTTVLDIKDHIPTSSKDSLLGDSLTPRTTTTSQQQQDQASVGQQVVELNKLHWSMEKLFDDEETRTLFEQFLQGESTSLTTTTTKDQAPLTMIHGGYALLKFVEAVDQFRELKSHVNRFMRAKTIIQQFIGDIFTVGATNAGESSLVKECCEYEINISLDTRKEFLQQFVAKCHMERCPKSLFDSISEQKFLELQLDSFKRFVRSEKFLNFMTKKKARMEWKDFVGSYVQKNVEGTIYMNKVGYKSLGTQQHAGGQELDGQNNTQSERDEPKFVNRGIDWIQSELPEGVLAEQMDPMLQKLMHPRMGIPFVFSSLTKTKFWAKFKNSFAQLKKKMKSRNSGDGVEAAAVAAEAVAAEQKAKREFSGATMIDHMCDYLKFNKNDQDSREKMAQLASLMLNKKVIGPVASQTTTSSTSSVFSEKDLYTFLLKKKLVIVGGGGMGAFLVFKALHATNQFDITVIDKRANWEYMISFHHLVSVPDKLPELQTSIAEEIASINQGGVNNSQFIRGMAKHISEYAVHVQRIDDNEKMEDETTVVPFDYLLVGTGSSYRNPFPIVKNETEPKNNATIIYPYSSSSIVNHIDAIRSARNIAVIGGGPVALEFVGELCHHAKETQKVHLISQCDVLLERLSEEAHWTAFATLASYKNIQFLFNRRVTQVVGNTIEYCFNEDASQDYLCKGELEADVVFCCVGFQPNTSCFERFMGDSLTDRGYVKVNPETLQVQRTGVKPTPYSWNDKLAVDVDPMGFALKSVNQAVIQEDVLRKEQEELELLWSKQQQDEPSVEEPNIESKSHVSDEDFSDEAKVAELMPMIAAMTTPTQNPEDLYGQFGPVSETEYYDHIFAIGDITYTVEEKLAYVARCHAAAFIKIVQNLENREPLTPYKATGYRTQNISLGPRGGVAIKGQKVQAKGPAVIKLKSLVEVTVVRDYKPSFKGHQKRRLN